MARIDASDSNLGGPTTTRARAARTPAGGLAGAALTLTQAVVGRVGRGSHRDRLLPLRAQGPLGPSVALSPDDRTASGELVVAEARWQGGRPGPATVLRSLADVPPLAVSALAAAVDGGAQVSFPTAVLDAARDLVTAREAAPLTLAADARAVPFVTLDPWTTKMRDQAFHLENWHRDGQPDGYTLRYAIADAVSLVPMGSPQDAEARRRGLSYYMLRCGLPEELKLLPLLPHELTAAAGSLEPHADRPAFVATLRLDPDGTVVARALERATIRSQAGISFGAAAYYFDNDGAGPHVGPHDYGASLALLQDVAPRLIDQAARRGACYEVAPRPPLPPLRVEEEVLDPNAPPGGVAPVAQWNTHLSLITNAEVAGILARARLAAPYLGNPSLPPQLCAKIRAALAEVGVEWPETATLGERLGQLPLDEAGTAARARVNDLLPAAEYSPTPTPYWRGGFPAYVHYTNPMREYAAIITHHILHAYLAGAPVPYQAQGEMWAICAELNAARAHKAEVDRLHRVAQAEATALASAAAAAVPAAAGGDAPDGRSPPRRRESARGARSPGASGDTPVAFACHHAPAPPPAKRLRSAA